MMPGRHVDEIERSLTNQPPISRKVEETFENVRVFAKEYGKDILRLVPKGREQSLALTKLEESVMWAIKGIALNQDDVDPESAGWDVNTEQANQ